jgi:hypothetical protein
MLDFAWRIQDRLWLMLNLICTSILGLAKMTLDEKVRYGMVALSGASVVLATLGVHVNPLDVIGGMGTT